MTERTLVSCDYCGAVYDKDGACESVRCPTCEHTTDERRPVPKYGHVRVWWSE